MIEKLKGYQTTQTVVEKINEIIEKLNEEE